LNFLSSLANHLGWQAAHRFKIFLEPTRRDAGLRSLQPKFLKFFSREDERSGTQSSTSIIHEIRGDWKRAADVLATLQIISFLFSDQWQERDE